MTPRFTARSKVAIAGFAQSQVERHAGVPLGALAVDTAQRAIADAGLSREQIDGFATGSLLPSAGGQAIVDGVSIVTSNWLAENLGINPRFAAGFQGYGQLVGAVMLKGVQLWDRPRDVAIIAAWGLAGVFLARRCFRWVPHEG